MTPGSIENSLADHRIESVSAMLIPDGDNPSVNPPEWLEHTNPQVAIISLSATNNSNRPAQEVLNQLGDRSILRTDQHGTITLHTNGYEIWVEARCSTKD
jgi:beta-lactamase superfamily II metal-dependent hydrolase